MFQLQWKLGYTPDHWKSAHITLFPKKDPPTLPQNYRPIAVHNTIYKLWTKFIAITLQDYAEDNHIIHESQYGFRPTRSTAHATQLLTLLLEDARDNKQDIFVVKLDFASAYNRVNHARLFHTMQMLGFPPDAIKVVQSVYKNATIQIQTDPSLTPTTLPQNSGVIQGDTLSPLLFNIAIEPLLRWLHHTFPGSDPKGYTVINAKRSARALHHPVQHANIPSIAYADDSCIITNNIHRLQLQLKKIELFSEWSGIHLNPSKCEASAILHSKDNPTDTNHITPFLPP